MNSTIKMKTFLRSACVLCVLFVLFVLAPPAQAQTYRFKTLPNSYGTLPAGLNTNNLYFDNATGGAVNTGLKLPRRLADPGLSFQAQFQCATVTLAAVSFVLQGSLDGTNYHSVPGSALVAHVPASASSANNTNVVYFTNFPVSAVSGFNWIRLAGYTNGNNADVTSPVLQVGWWEQ
jgi:hypothetical protein